MADLFLGGNYLTQTTAWSNQWPRLMGVANVAGGFMAHNVFNKRPVFAGIHRIVIGGILGWWAFGKINDFSQRNSAERDAILRHYVLLHPEDFPPPPRKTFAEVLR